MACGHSIEFRTPTKGELDLLHQVRMRAEADARELMTHHDRFSEPALIRVHEARAQELKAKVTRDVRGPAAAKLVDETRQLREAMTRPGSFS